MWHADRGRLLLRTPGPVPLWDLRVFYCWDQSLLNLSCFRTFEFRTSLGSSVFVFSTALYRSLLKHCTLTNKAVGTIWRALSKSLKKRKGHDPLPLWLLVGTLLVLGPGFASRRVENNLLLRMSFYIFDILFYHLTCLWNNLWSLRFSWMLVLGLYNEDCLQRTYNDFFWYFPNSWYQISWNSFPFRLCF